MNANIDRSGVHPIVPQQFRCVWMTGGILSYQLCTRNFDCDACPLDKAMRTCFTGQENQDKQLCEPQAALKGDNYLFSKNHCWIQKLDRDIVRFGVEPALASLLISPREVILPSPGELVHSQRFSCWIVLENCTFPIASPFNGTVKKTNEALRANPHVLCSEPLSQGWLFEAEISYDELEPTRWLTKSKSEKIYDEDLSHFRHAVNSKLQGSNTGIGMTLHDGGNLIQDAATIIGIKNYHALLFETFCDKFRDANTTARYSHL